MIVAEAAGAFSLLSSSGFAGAGLRVMGVLGWRVWVPMTRAELELRVMVALPMMRVDSSAGGASVTGADAGGSWSSLLSDGGSLTGRAVPSPVEGAVAETSGLKSVGVGAGWLVLSGRAEPVLVGAGGLSVTGTSVDGSKGCSDISTPEAVISGGSGLSS